MSDLQLALLALGAVIIAIVLIYNWWQERRLAREAARQFGRVGEDALLDDFHIDPSTVDVGGQETLAGGHQQLDDPTLDAGATEQGPYIDAPEPRQDAAVESVNLPVMDAADDVAVFNDAGQPQATEAASTPHEAPPAPAELTIDPAGLLEEYSLPDVALPDSLDLHIDLVALVHLASPRSGATLRGELQPLPEFDRRTQWLGRDEAGAWHYLTADRETTSFTTVACGLQLADRSGPVSGNTLRDFQIKVEYLASNLGAPVEWLGEADPRQQAVELDQFCIGVDVTVGLHVMQSGNGPFTGTKLRGLAEAGGMKLHDDGKFHYQNDAGETQFVLSDQDGRPFTAESLRTAFVRGVNLQLDIPRASQCLETFNQMVLFGRQLESGLRGRLVDDNQRELGDADIDKIRQQLKGICARLSARGIEPGSPSALRLFS